eukprot:TRINITY_DN102237_c0_g1_i1.p1 TRINITY_DN102237_c0_g1~~TRINITY_DN102237_c0_g1_i1.p1  ORF type:complete len:580 (-),score=107.21 TRINITY_DN102237_c0_g1_i1:180-1889(-)
MTDVAVVIDDVEAAHFVALKLDVSSHGTPGAQNSGQRMRKADDSCEAHFAACADYVRRGDGPFPQRLGLCCARWSDEEGVWLLRAHEVGLWPGGDVGVPKEHIARRLRVANGKWKGEAEDVLMKGFSREGKEEATGSRAEPSARLRRNAAFPHADSMERAALLAAAHGFLRSSGTASQAAAATESNSSRQCRWSQQVAASAKWVLAALHRAEVPLLFYDGCHDLMHIYDKFLADVPQSHFEFGRRWLEFSPLVFDAACIEQDVSAADRACCADLEALHRRLMQSTTDSGSSGTAPFKELGFYTHRAASARNGLVAGTGEGYAAREAMSVAEVFFMQLARHHEAACIAGRPTPPSKRPCEWSTIATGIKRPRSSPEGFGGSLLLSRQPSGISETSTAADTADAMGSGPAASPVTDAESATAAPVGVSLQQGSPNTRSVQPMTPPQPCWLGCLRPVPAISKASQCAEHLAVAAERLALFFKHLGRQTSDDVEAQTMEFMKNAHNRIASAGRRAKPLRLDAVVQAKLVKGLKLKRCDATMRLARFLWAGKQTQIRLSASKGMMEKATTATAK